MRKEVIFAIIIGALFGVAIVIGIKRLNTSSPTEDTIIEPTVSQNETVQNEGAGTIYIAVSNPQEKDVVTSSPVEISGISLANSWIVLVSEDEDQVVRANSNGEFSFETELSGGINKFKLTALDSNGQKATEELTLVYTTQLEDE